MSERIRILDTTLRDGGQSAAINLSTAERLAIAEQLRRLAVDVIEAGFPAASSFEFDAVSRIAAEIGGSDGPVIAGLARAISADIDSCWQALRHASRPRIHVFIATSTLHLQHKLRMSSADLLDRVHRMVSDARSRCADVQFSAEDATRTDPSFLCDVLQAAAEAGATTLNVPDTVGCSDPYEYGDLVRDVRARVRGIDGCTLSAHCHNDLGLATANTVAAVRAGARQVEVTVNGIGERAGNAALEEVVVFLHTRRDRYFPTTRIDLSQLADTSRIVSQLTGVAVPSHKAIVGHNAFSHASGVHQDGLLKHRRTYELLDPTTIGRAWSHLVLGHHSGRRAIRTWLSELGVAAPSDKELRSLVGSFCSTAKGERQEQAEITPSLLDEAQAQDGGIMSVESVRLGAYSSSGVKAEVSAISREGEHLRATVCGSSDTEAVFTAIGDLAGVVRGSCEYLIQPSRQCADGRIECVVGVRLRDASHAVSYGLAAHREPQLAWANACVAALNKHLSNHKISQDGRFCFTRGRRKLTRQ